MKNTPCAVELLLIAAVLAAAAAIELAKALAALVLTLWGYRPGEECRRATTDARGVGTFPPAVHPLLIELEGLTVAQLRPVAGVRSKRHRKAELIDLAGVALAC
jgi:hypothetical protein